MKKLCAKYILFLFFFLLLGCSSNADVLTMRAGGVKLTVELAETPKQREKGLQERKNLAENRGMLFLFPVSQELSFWSKKTYIPLSIAFLDDSGKIVQIESLPPEQLDPVRSEQPLRYALEVNAGWFQKNGIGVGDYLRIERE